LKAKKCRYERKTTTGMEGGIMPVAKLGTAIRVVKVDVGGVEQYDEMPRKVRHRVDALEQLECCGAHRGKEGIDVGREQTNQYAYVVSLEVLGDNAERSPRR
jgi:hypothetical protein